MSVPDAAPTHRSGPLRGVRVVELGGIGPGPHGCALLADLGCDVVTIASPSQVTGVDVSREATNPLSRGKRSVEVDLKTDSGVAAVLELCDRADVLVDPFRPGVCERLGIGPDVVCARNPRLIFTRLTGWGQHGPYAQQVGHDINYLATSGVLSMLGNEPDGPPTVPLNLLADFAGGGMLLALGVSAALAERASSGRGQVLDVAMVDGLAAIAGPFFHAVVSGAWGPRGTNLLDGGAHFYTTYRTADDRWIAVGAIEPQFYAALLDVLGLHDDPPQWDRSGWPQWRDRLGAVFVGETRDHWVDRFSGTDACVSPVLDPTEAVVDAHLRERQTIVDVGGVPQWGPAPRFGRTPGGSGAAVHPGATPLAEVVDSWG